MSRAAIPVAIGVGAGILALFALTRKAEAAPPPTAVPTTDDIMEAGSIHELETYYDLASELYIIGKIGREDYMKLYEAYRARFNELIGGAE